MVVMVTKSLFRLYFFGTFMRNRILGTKFKGKMSSCSIVMNKKVVGGP